MVEKNRNAFTPLRLGLRDCGDAQPSHFSFTEDFPSLHLEPCYMKPYLLATGKLSLPHGFYK